MPSPLLHCSKRRLVYGCIPPGDRRSKYARVVFVDFGLPGMLALTVELIAPENRAFHRRCVEADAVAFRGQIRCRNTEDYAVKPEVPVLAIAFLRPKTYRNWRRDPFALRDNDAVVVNHCSDQITGDRCADIVDPEL